MVETVTSCFFSVIMPAFNAAEFIEKAIVSVQKQTFSHWELIIINDGSTDGTPDIVNRYQEQDSRIRIINQANKKQGAARNAGICDANGSWIAFLDADDEWLPQKLTYQYNIIQSNPDIDVISTSGYTRFDQESVNAYYHYSLKPGRFEGKDMYALEMFNNYIPILSVVFKREQIDKVGLFDESSDVQGCEDHDYWLRLAKAGAVFFNSDERTFIYYVHPGNISNQYGKQSFSSANVRLKNFDNHLLSPLQSSDMAHDITKTARFLRLNQMAEQADSLAGNLQKLGIKYLPVYKQNKLGSRVKHKSKQVLAGIFKTFVFPLKKKIAKYNLRIAAEYQKWLYQSNFKAKGPLTISPKAKIDFGHKQARIITHGMQIGDFTYLNLTTNNSELVTGSGFVLNKFSNFNILGNVHIGSNVLFNNYCTLHCFSAIDIGDNCWFGESVKLYDHNHRYKVKDTPFTSQGYTTGKIVIGNNVWVGSNTVILQNVTIGDNCVIGANNIIHRSIPANTIVKSGQEHTY